MAAFAPYGHAILSLAIWALIVVGLSLLSTIGRSDAVRCDCGKPKRDYSDPVYRRERAFMNAVETSGAFTAATMAAMLAGGAPFWVNLLASVFLVSRIVMAAVHVGTQNQPLRSLTYGIGWVCIIALAVVAIVAVL